MKLYWLFHQWTKPVLRCTKRRQNRRSVSRLLAYEKHQLEDIGISRADVLLALSSRLEKDPSPSGSPGAGSAQGSGVPPA